MADRIDTLKATLAPQLWTQDPDIIDPYMREWRDKYVGHTPLMLTPETTADVAQMVKLCAKAGLKIVPQGGNTGLVGGQTPLGEVLLSTRRMTKIHSLDPVNNALIAQAGATLLSVQEAAARIDRKFPLSLASEGSCTIGGNLSTNAGGVHVLKYGTTKDLVFGVEAVLPSGEIFNGLTSLRKDNTGYDLSRLFLGAEGTLGIITQASLKLFPRPGHVQRIMMGINSPADAVDLLERCRVGDSLAMFEVIPQIGLDLVLRHIPGQRDPFANKHPWYALIDWEVDDAAAGQTLAETVLSKAIEDGLVRDAIVAQSQTQAAELLALREHMSAGQKGLGGSIKLDITVPINRIADFFDTADKAAKAAVPGCRPVGFGHFGDGNIHYNIAQPEGADKAQFLSQWQALSEIIFDIVDRFDGSISAEHGIGTMKKADLAERADNVKLHLLQSIKKSLDPDNLMNPRVLV